MATPCRSVGSNGAPYDLPLVFRHENRERAGWRSRYVPKGLEHEHKPITVEVREPFIPGDWPESCGTGEIEADPGATVVDVDRRRSRFARLSRCWLGSVSLSPFANHVVVA